MIEKLETTNTTELWLNLVEEIGNDVPPVIDDMYLVAVISVLSKRINEIIDTVNELEEKLAKIEGM